MVFGVPGGGSFGGRSGSGFAGCGRAAVAERRQPGAVFKVTATSGRGRSGTPGDFLLERDEAVVREAHAIGAGAQSLDARRPARRDSSPRDRPGPRSSRDALDRPAARVGDEAVVPWSWSSFAAAPVSPAPSAGPGAWVARLAGGGVACRSARYRRERPCTHRTTRGTVVSVCRAVSAVGHTIWLSRDTPRHRAPFREPRHRLRCVRHPAHSEGTITWVRDRLDQSFTPRRVERLPPAYHDIVLKYSFIDAHCRFVLCWDHARFVNHSCDPTCLSAGYDFELAVRDIRPARS